MLAVEKTNYFWMPPPKFLSFPRARTDQTKEKERGKGKREKERENGKERETERERKKEKKQREREKRKRKKEKATNQSTTFVSNAVRKLRKSRGLTIFISLFGKEEED